MQVTWTFGHFTIRSHRGNLSSLLKAGSLQVSEVTGPHLEILHLQSGPPEDVKKTGRTTRKTSLSKGPYM